jgi:hypothetical protein
VAALGVTPAVTFPPSVQAWTELQGTLEPPVATGAVLAATELVGSRTSPAARVVLKRWDRSNGTSLADVELLRGPHILEFRSVDEQHLLIAERVAPGEFEEYEWSVFSLETGERIGKFRHHRSHAQFFVADSTIVFVEPPYSRRESDKIVDHPRQVRAAVLGSGSVIWERELRDTAYRGPFPP